MTKPRVLAAMLLAAAPAVAQDAPRSQSVPVTRESPAARDARMAWWRDARFGMFIHWGLYRVPAGTWNGNRVAGIGEWIMARGPIPVHESFASSW